MADGALDLAGRGVKALCDAGIQLLGDVSHQLGFVHHHANALAQILIALDVGGNSYGQKEVGNPLLQAPRSACGTPARLDGHRFRATLLACHLEHALGQQREIKRLYHVVACAKIDRPGDEIIPAQRRQHDYTGHPRKLHALQVLQHAVSVHLRHDHVADQNVRLLLLHLFNRFQPIVCRAGNLNAILLGKKLC